MNLGFDGIMRFKTVAELADILKKIDENQVPFLPNYYQDYIKRLYMKLI